MTPPVPVSSKRVQVLREIAEKYVELTDPAGQSGELGSGDRVPLMPRTYTATVKEFERLLAVMRNQAKQQAYSGFPLGKLRWHLIEFYVAPMKVRRNDPVTVVSHGKRRQLRNGDGTLRTRPVIVTRRHRDARKDRADLALDWMAANWGLVTEPMLPSELSEQAAA